VGTGYAVGGQTGWYVYAEAGHNKNHQKMNRTTYQNTLLDSDNIVLKSGGDTVLSGAQAHANQIITRIGGDLLINSLQDHQQETGSGT
ncbi:hemagglutinin repeat-containing protein, partial [Chryseobacterium gambrini]|uniref:hemagglutinin repeat-containing protein n=1 Tax=Chryseobacterium gambrini TaxID=373672 RepID=UPI0025B50F97